MIPSPARPEPTEFERLIPRRRSYIEAARLYVRRHGHTGAQDAILRDMRAGRLPRLKADHMRGFLLFLLVESVCRRIGYNHYGALLLDREFIDTIAAELDVQDLLQGPFSNQQREQFALQATADALHNWHYVAQDLAGNPIYTVTPMLARTLREPQTCPWPCATLRLPVPALMLLVPPEADLTLEHEGGQRPRVTEIYVVESPAPERRWFLWICAPLDERVVVTEYLNVGLADRGSLEDSLRETEAAHASSANASSTGWPRCVRFLAGAMRYLADGGVHQERWFDKEARHIHERLARLGPHQHKQRDVLRARLQTLDAGRRIVLGLHA
jgi:hypothetical protein